MFKNFLKRSRPQELAIAGDIAVKSAPDGVPQFKRCYSSVLSAKDSINLKVTVKNLGSSTMEYGELTQADGRWVLFDPNRPADKILDPMLVPLVQAKCRAILEIDRAFRASRPSKYVDECGNTWQRVEKL